MMGILIYNGPINPYGLGLMSLSPIMMEIMGVDRPDRTKKRCLFGAKYVVGIKDVSTS